MQHKITAVFCLHSLDYVNWTVKCFNDSHWSVCCPQDVAVSVVGKYCYHMHSPAEHQTLPVIVDIILVGRTKIITLHSSIWLINSTDRHVAFRLHVPITPLVAPARVGPPNRKQRTTDHVIGPLDPNAGMSPCTHAPFSQSILHAQTRNLVLVDEA